MKDFLLSQFVLVQLRDKNNDINILNTPNSYVKVRKKHSFLSASPLTLKTENSPKRIWEKQHRTYLVH